MASDHFWTFGVRVVLLVLFLAPLPLTVNVVVLSVDGVLECTTITGAAGGAFIVTVVHSTVELDLGNLQTSRKSEIYC